MNGRKVIVKTKWPQGPAIGTILEERKAGKYYSDGMFGYCMECELEGFVEEVKEPEYYWTMTEWGNVAQYAKETTVVPSWLRFATKESAEKFAKVLKSTHPYTFHGSCREFYELCEALNDRVK